MADALGDEWWLTNDEPSTHCESLEQPKEKPAKLKGGIGDKKLKRKKATTSTVSVGNVGSGVLTLAQKKELHHEKIDKSRTKRSKLTAKNESKTQVGTAGVLEAEPWELKDKPKKKKKRKKKKISDDLADKPPSAPSAADLLQFIKSQSEGTLSTIEAEEVELQDEHVGPCKEVGEDIPQFLNRLLPDWCRHLVELGSTQASPVLLIVCISAIRAVAVRRAIQDVLKLQKGMQIGKLFAKHFSVTDQAKFLQKTVVPIGLGTPNRIHKLLEEDALWKGQLRYIVLDWTYRDDKLQRLSDQKLVRRDLFTLMHRHLIPLVRNSCCRFSLV
ncbi:PREDICTED: protein CMSS1-like [Priapulus caudatus]|uniref:Protein CMSS1-like n=1 Tax=Priapulus caudatus TaxID=37621 RepID=A0ABM1EVS9_PRICU|nr:PREDICTED: protein CMSS1-like [Priapulus caudatus]